MITGLKSCAKSLFDPSSHLTTGLPVHPPAPPAYPSAPPTYPSTRPHRQPTRPHRQPTRPHRQPTRPHRQSTRPHHRPTRPPTRTADLPVHPPPASRPHWQVIELTLRLPGRYPQDVYCLPQGLDISKAPETGDFPQRAGRTPRLPGSTQPPWQPRPRGFTRPLGLL